MPTQRSAAEPITGVLGLGRFGASLTRSLRDIGWPVAPRGRQADDSDAALAAWARDCDILCLAIRDDQIDSVVARLAKLDLTGKAALIHSGLKPLEALAPLRDRGVATAKFHPLQAFAKNDGAPIPAGTPFAIEGQAPPAVYRWARAWSCPIRALSGELWSRYHLAAVTAANFLPLFIRAGAELLEPLAKDRQDALTWLRPLVERSVAAALDPANPLPFSGPAVRGDRQTIAAHLSLLAESSPDLAELYRRATEAVLTRAGHAMDPNKQ